MNLPKRNCIAVLMADMQSEYNHKMLEGIVRQANALNYDVLAFSFFSNHDIDMEFQYGEENIFNLINTKKLVGIIARKDSFVRPAIRIKIAQICQESGLPFIDIDNYNANEAYCIWNDRIYFKKLVNHLIEVHHKKKIYCLTGFRGYHQSEHRVDGYRDALLEHGLEPRLDYIFYGDFWKESAIRLANDIASGKVECPDAVACASAAMASNLIKQLIANGIRVPEDVAVVSYDDFLENAMITPSITSISNISYIQGINCVCNLHLKITGERCTPIANAAHKVIIEVGKSCGCDDSNNRVLQNYKNDLLEQLFYVDMLQVSGMIQQISAPDTLQEFWNVLYRFLYLIRNLDRLYLCICDDWDGIVNNKTNDYRKVGYSDQMLLFSGTTHDNTTDYTIFSSAEMLPIIGEGEYPSAYFFTPLHYDDRCFGYIALKFLNNQYSFDKQFWTWRDNVCTALETMRIRHYIQRFNERIHLTVVRDPLTGLYNRRGFEELSADMFEQAIIHQEKFFLMAVNIYNLKEINKKMGYTYGDNIILTVAEAINYSCRGNEICCRTSNDYFYIIGAMDYLWNAGKQHEELIQQYCTMHLRELENDIHVEVDTGFFCEKIGEGVTLAETISRVRDNVEQKRLQDKKRITYFNRFMDLRKRIYSQPEYEWNVDKMSRMMMLSRAYFQRLYKKNFGVSPMTDVINARITLAKKMLEKEQLSIAEIATACGYDSEVYFMQQFKKETGKTPSQFRKESIG